MGGTGGRPSPSDIDCHPLGGTLNHEGGLAENASPVVFPRTSEGTALP
jgi:hypothetical protein